MWSRGVPEPSQGREALCTAQAFFIRANVVAAGTFVLGALGLCVWLAAFPSLCAERVLPICSPRPSLVVPRSYDAITPDLLQGEEFTLAHNDGC
jgi:hypothetical protein